MPDIHMHQNVGQRKAIARKDSLRASVISQGAGRFQGPAG